MKKFFIAAIALLASVTGVKAEENVTLPASGDFSVEVQFNPFGNDFDTFGLDNMKLKGRYFFGDQDAVRMGLGFGVNSNKVTPNPEGVGNEKDVNNTQRIGNFAIDLGYERHFVKKGRIDLYAGAGLGFAMQNSCDTEKFYSNNEQCTKKTFNKNSYTTFDVNAFSGIDFYVYKGLYLGAEIGVKIGFKTIPGQYTKGEFSSISGTWSNDIKSKKGAKSTNLNLATYVVPALRIGWTF